MYAKFDHHLFEVEFNILSAFCRFCLFVVVVVVFVFSSMYVNIPAANLANKSPGKFHLLVQPGTTLQPGFLLRRELFLK